MAKKDNSTEENLFAAASYLGILFLVPLLAKKESKFCQFHAKQGLALFVISIAVAFLGMIPLLGWFLIMPLGMLFVGIMAVWGIVSCLMGKETRLPLVSDLAEKFKV